GRRARAGVAGCRGGRRRPAGRIFRAGRGRGRRRVRRVDVPADVSGTRRARRDVVVVLGPVGVVLPAPPLAAVRGADRRGYRGPAGGGLAADDRPRRRPADARHGCAVQPSEREDPPMRRLILVGTGVIAQAHAAAVATHADRATIVAAVDVGADRLAAFADKHASPRPYSWYEDPRDREQV